MAPSMSPPATVPRSAPTTPPADAAEAIERAFFEFRESAVRLAERVNDLSATNGEPAVATQDDLKLVRTIFGKWSSDVLLALHTVPSIGFEDLRRQLVGISPRVLSLKLKELEQNGMVQRDILDTRPPRVRYALTERGWTVAWLAQPVLLFLRHTELREKRVDGSSAARARSHPAATA